MIKGAGGYIILSTCQGTILSVSHIVMLICKTKLWSRYYYYPHSRPKKSRGTERLIALPKATELAKSRARIHTKVFCPESQVHCPCSGKPPVAIQWPYCLWLCSCDIFCLQQHSLPFPCSPKSLLFPFTELLTLSISTSRGTRWPPPFSVGWVKPFLLSHLHIHSSGDWAWALQWSTVSGASTQYLDYVGAQ